ncbi:MAG: 5-formyltetrahydrofolate cyclo-ligase [Spirochaetota bacterium]
MLTKRNLRKEQKKRLAEVSRAKQLYEENIQTLLVDFFASQRFRVISYFADALEVELGFLSEVATLQLYYPRIVDVQNRVLQFVLPQSWEKGPYGIRQPTGSVYLEPRQADWIIVPALAFNGQGFRLGRGGGYYDRALQSVRQEKLIGVLWLQDLLLDFSPDDHDICIAKLISNDGVLNFV